MNNRFVWLHRGTTFGQFVRKGDIGCLVSTDAMIAVTYEERLYKVRFGGKKPPLDWVPKWGCTGDVITDGVKADTVFFRSWKAVEAFTADLRKRWSINTVLFVNNASGQDMDLSKPYALYFGN